MPFTEANYENAVIEVFRDTLGYRHVYAPDLTRDYADPLYTDELLPALRRINPDLPEAAISDAVYKLRNFEGGSLIQKNARFMDYLQNGIPVNFHDPGCDGCDHDEQRAALVYLADYKNADRQFHLPTVMKYTQFLLICRRLPNNAPLPTFFPHLTLRLRLTQKSIITWSRWRRRFSSRGLWTSSRSVV